jgi:hypothetical protein
MTPEEVAALLAYASAADPRIRRKDPEELRLQVRFWHGQLVNVDLAAARRAVEAHYAQPGVDAVLPGDVRSGARGSDAERHPAYRPLREAISAADEAAGGSPMPALPPGPGDRQSVEEARARLAAAFDRVAAARALPDGDGRPTGFDPRRRMSVDWRNRPQRRDVTHDRRGRPLTACHRCVGDMLMPDGWDPTNPESPPVHCGPCLHEMAAERGEAS